MPKDKENVNRRISVTLPPKYREDLEEMATETGENLTAYAGYLIRLKIEEWRSDKKNQLLKEQQILQERNKEFLTLIHFIKVLMGTESSVDFEQISCFTGIQIEQLEALYHETTGQDFKTSATFEEGKECEK